ncbi:MAG: GIY-YIG nuclease family protein [Patescibacteria group bacterium]
MFFVYVLISLLDKKLYVGYTPDDVYRRLEKHQRGIVPSTKNRRPFKLMFFEAFLSEQDALRRERYFKTNQGRKALKIISRESLKIITRDTSGLPGTLANQ